MKQPPALRRSWPVKACAAPGAGLDDAAGVAAAGAGVGATSGVRSGPGRTGKVWGLRWFDEFRVMKILGSPGLCGFLSGLGVARFRTHGSSQQKSAGPTLTQNSSALAVRTPTERAATYRNSQMKKSLHENGAAQLQ